MNKIVWFVLALVLIAGCIEIEDAAKDTLNETLNIDFGEPQAKEEPAPVQVSAKPDLTISTIYWSTLYPEPGDSDELNFKVQNKGNVSVAGFNYKINLVKEESKWKEETYISNRTLNPGDEAKLEEGFVFNETGRFKAEVYIDWDNSIPESDEMNNHKEATSITVEEAYVPEEDEEQDSESDEGLNKTENRDWCEDTDNGIKYYEKGRCTDNGPFTLGMDDYCKDKFTLIELYCTNSTQRCRFAEPYECYCKNGACV